MKIVQINTVCGTGSTGKIAVDIYKLAEGAGYEPFIAYGRGQSPACIHGYKVGNPIDFAHHVFVNFFLGKSGFGSKAVTKRFLNWLDEIQPDLLHLHNLHGFYIHVGLLFDYIKAHDLPVVWTLHDCWPLTGQCAHFEYAKCSKWRTGCFDCPIYRTDYPYSLFRDNSKNNYILKKNAFCGVNNLTICVPSQWLSDIVKLSYLNEYPISIIPNGINLDIYSCSAQNASNKERIILGVANVWNNKKGLNAFLELDKILDDTWQIVLIGLTPKQQAFIRNHSKRILPLAKTANQVELVKWYNRAYVYLNPTLEDTFPTTNLEALACGTPVITYRTGGSPECITKESGIVVEKGNIQQLKNSILSLEASPFINAESCRKQAMNYDKNTRFQEYLNIYHSIMEKKR